MKQNPSNPDPQERRGIRRTVWILAGVVIAIFALTIIETVLSR